MYINSFHKSFPTWSSITTLQTIALYDEVPYKWLDLQIIPISQKKVNRHLLTQQVESATKHENHPHLAFQQIFFIKWTSNNNAYLV